MAASTVAESAASSRPYNTIRLALNGINYGSTPVTARQYTVLVTARSQDTVAQVVGCLGRRGGAVLHAVYADQRLPPGATIGGLRLPHDASLRVTPYPDAWCLAYKISGAATRFHHQSLLQPEQPLGAPHASPEQLSWDTVRLVHEFLDKAGECHPGRMVGEFLAVFLYSGLARLLARLYFLSTRPVCHYRAKAAMECFLDPSTIARLPLHVEVWTVPLYLRFCQAMVSVSPRHGREDPLYKGFRDRLAAVLRLHEHLPRALGYSMAELPKEWVLEQLTPFAQETANEVVADINAGSLPPAGTLLEFKTFFSVTCRQVARAREDASFSPAGPVHPVLPHITVQLTATATSLLRSVDGLLERLPLPSSEEAGLPDWARHEGWTDTLWVVLGAVNSWSHVGSGGWTLTRLLATIGTQAARLNAFVLGTGASRSRQEDVVRLVMRLKRVLRFEARRHLAAAMLPSTLLPASHRPPPFELLVDRTRLLEDSFAYVSRASRHELLNCELSIQFLHEEASQEGVVREWLALLCRALFDQQLALFSSCPHNRRRFFLNPASAANHPLNLQYLNFAGKIIGLALIYNVQVGILFQKTLFMQLAMDDISEDPLLHLDDIADANPVLHSNCRQILQMDPALVDELITNIFVNSTKEQLVSFAGGFSSTLVDPGMRGAFFRSLYLEDLDKMLGGNMGAIDVEEWKGNVEYRGYNEEDVQIKWFWEAVESMTAEEQRRLLFFWTAVEYLPFDGFRGLGFRLIIARAFNDTPDYLPSSNTCSYLLNLPSYSSFAMTLSRLKIIAQEHV